MKNSKRVFVGMPAGTEIRLSAAAFTGSHAGFDVRWVKPEYLHVTLIPPWQCMDAGSVCRELQEVAGQYQPMPVSFERVSAGPSARNSRILWATGSAPESLPGLRMNLQERLGRQEETSSRGFLLHVTIARFRSTAPAGKGLSSLNETVDWHGSLASLCLYESILEHTGAEYRVICEFALTGI
jgi:2'-5' RNA ligase